MIDGLNWIGLRVEIVSTSSVCVCVCLFESGRVESGCKDETLALSIYLINPT
jgi:hypothetical protein